MYYNPNTQETKFRAELCTFLNASIPYNTPQVDEWYLISDQVPIIDSTKQKYKKGEIVKEGDSYVQKYIVEDLTEEELAANAKAEQEEKLRAAKQERNNAINNLTVDVDGMTFDANETSQARISRIVLANHDQQDVSVPWVLADNTIADVKIWQLRVALEKATQKMSELWIAPYNEI